MLSNLTNMPHNEYDVLIVGAGIAGSSLAHALSTLPRPKPLRIALLERSLAEPDRIVGELLQPGGYGALKKLGLGSCLEGIDAVPAKGYCVLDAAEGRSVRIPYPGGHEGRSFHHGRLIMNLRAAARRAEGVEVIEATVTDLIEDEETKRVVGVRALRKDSNSTGETSETSAVTTGVTAAAEKEPFYAGLVVVADGCFSNFRTSVMGDAGAKPTTRSHFVGAILKNAELPMPKHGTVALVKGFGPVLLYQVSERSTRMLVDVKVPLPSDLKAHILTNIVPQLPPSLHLPVQVALDKDRLRRMPNSFLPSVKQGIRQGVVLLGDSWNMRHPLTGGGMTVAFNDVVTLRSLLGSVSDFKDWVQMKKVLQSWHWKRKPLSSTINILSVALYDLFSADDEELAILRTGCFKYFECGGQCIDGPVSLLSGIAPSPLLLAAHFFAVAFYSIWVLFTHPSPVRPLRKGVEPVYTVPRIHQYPSLFIMSLKVFWKACIVFGPLLWSEIRWWSPTDTRRRNSVLISIALPLLALMGGSLLWTSSSRVV